MSDQTSNPESENLVLVLNAVSSSLKFAVFNNRRVLIRTFTGAIDRIGSSKASFTLSKTDTEQTEGVEIRATNHIAVLEYLLERTLKTGQRLRIGFGPM